MSETVRRLHEEFTAVENVRLKLESAELIVDHEIQDMQDLSDLNSTSRQALIKLRGIHCILSQVNSELADLVLQADELVFCNDGGAENE